MRLLLIEDDELKRLAVVDFLRSVLSDLVITEAHSFQSGLRRIVDGHYDLILLDMTMPTFDIDEAEDGGRPQSYAGRELLRNMKRRGISVPTLVVTQFDRFGVGREALTLEALDAELRRGYPQIYLGSVFYGAGDEEWKRRLREVLTTVSQSGRGEA